MKTNNKVTEQKLSATQLKTREKIIKDLLKNKSSLVKRYGKEAEKVLYGRSTNIAKKMTNNQNIQKLKELVRKSLMKEQDIEVGADRYEEEQDTTMASNLLDTLESLLQKHDWYYEMSDDDRVYRQGTNKERDIKKRMSELSSMGYGKDAKALFDKYNPYNKTNESFPDLTGDGKVTKADILKGRGVELDEALSSEQKMVETFLKRIAKEFDYSIQDAARFVKDTINKMDLKESSVNEDLDIGHTDNEPHMLKGDLYRIGKYAMELYQMVDQFEGPSEVDFPHWWQAKIIKAKEMIVAAKHYLDFETKEPAIDSMIDTVEDEGTLFESIVNESVGSNFQKPGLAETIIKKLKESSYKTSPNSVEARSLKKGDILTSGDKVVSVSSGAKTPSGKVEVTLEKNGKTKTSIWGKYTKVGVKKS